MNEKDAKLLKFLQSKNSKFELVNYQFELLNESTVRIIRFEGAGHSTVYEGLVAINEIERTIDRAGFDDVRFCDACGAPMDCGWSDEIGLTHFCSEEEFAADMDERYGKGNWRAEPEGGKEWNYEYRDDENSPWQPESSFYTEWY